MRKARRHAAGALLALAIGLVALVGPATASAAPKVLVVGDSLEESTGPNLEKYLPGVEVTVNAVGGSNTFEILDLFEESYEPSYSVIVFDGGTNDNPNYPQILEENLAKVAATVGNRCMVVPTIHGYTVEGANNRGKNRVVHAFAASRPGTQVPDWATVANTRPDLMQEDNLHPSEEGADYRAQLIADGIIGCLTVAETTPGPVAETASASTVTTEEFDPPGRMAKREEELLRALGGDVLRRVAMLTAVQAIVGR
ncbi:MAG TPA: hypothetical protein VHR18_13125 [Solirubrobacterales bacterium]|jgi:lysophospholipase L1-like esterase|nr:hypothetical protein [Solirubrobacterales bacterium]